MTLKLRITRKRGIALSLLALLALAAGGAYAYFTATGTATDQGAGTVGTTTPFQVTFGTATGTMYPGAGSTVIPFTITNEGTGYENLSSAAVVIPDTVGDGSGDIEDAGVDVTGCLAAWFSATVSTAPSYGDLAPNGQSGDSATGDVTVTMSDSGTDQDACENATPDITVNAS